jgi:putative membrane protein
MIDAINNLNFKVLLPVVLGSVFGLIGFSYILSWIYKKYRNQTIGILSGFILGSLGIIYPWKNPLIQTFSGKEKVIGYNYFLPQINFEFFFAIALMILGFLCIWLMEVQANKNKSS